MSRQRCLILAGYHIFYNKGRSKLQTLANAYGQLCNRKEAVFLSNSDFAVPLQDFISMENLKEFLYVPNQQEKE